MRALVIVAGLLCSASGYYTGGIIGGGGSGGWGDGGWRGGVVSRDAPTEDLLDKSYVPNAIRLFVGHAMSGVTSEDLVNHCNKIKSGAQAQLDASGETISDEETDALLREMAAKYPLISPVDLLNSNALTDESYRMTTSVKIMIDCAEEMKTRQRKGESYAPQLKVVIRLCEIIKIASARLADLYYLNLYDRAVNKRDLELRQDFLGGVTGSYDPNNGLTVGGQLGYKDNNFNVGGHVDYNKNSGLTAGGSLDYTKNNFNVGGSLDYNRYSGLTAGANVGYNKDNLSVVGNVGYNPNSGVSVGAGLKLTFR